MGTQVWQEISGGVTAPRGYRAAGIAAGLKPSGAPDLALIWSESEAIAAGVFTQVQMRAACVDYCQQRLQEKAAARAILVNAGQANACTGAQGMVDALDCAQTLAQALSVPPELILLASTGVIGHRIKMEPLKAAIPRLVAEAMDANQAEGAGAAAAAQAIITTDLVTKTVALEGMVEGRPVRIGGMAKGSGMIHPNMATMLAFLTCDAAVSPSLWQQMLSRAASQSFNQITVDGDTSTNDTVLALANGQSRTPSITEEESPQAQQLQAMLTAACIELAKAVARDGEGATCLLEVWVTGAVNDPAARQVARTIASSSLVKSAVFGRDPNWGRIAAAAGRAGIPFNPSQLQVKLGDFLLMDAGTPLPFDRASASHYLKQPDVMISVDLGDGSGVGTAWGCDLSYDYVKINAEYTT